MQIYVVRQGDTLDSISAGYGIDSDRVAYANQIEYPYALAIGQALLIPEENFTGEDKRQAFVNGYAYPFITEEVLEETLPYLTSLSVFSYGFTTQGDLIPPELDDMWMIEAAGRFGVRPILTLTPFDSSGNFNNELISVLLDNWQAQQNLINQMLDTMNTKGFKGADIDFEFILPEDRIVFAEFVAMVRSALSEFGYTVSVALAPKISPDQKGLLYEGKDYALLGAAADSVLLMTYEWGYTYGPPMAVAPLNKVREVVEYAISEIPPEKIDLGIPNYGYDWALPYERGVTAAETIGNVEAVQIAVAHGAVIKFDEVALSPYFNYTEGGVEHVVWFEDVRSLREKFNLVKDYKLRGMGYWQIMKLFRANWLLLADTFQIV